jgi:hypothetical protein
LIVRGFNISNEPIQVAVRVLREFTTPIHFNLGLFSKTARRIPRETRLEDRGERVEIEHGEERTG